jgi:hypothetical protein
VLPRGVRHQECWPSWRRASGTAGAARQEIHVNVLGSIFHLISAPNTRPRLLALLRSRRRPGVFATIPRRCRGLGRPFVCHSVSSTVRRFGILRRPAIATGEFVPGFLVAKRPLSLRAFLAPPCPIAKAAGVTRNSRPGRSWRDPPFTLLTPRKRASSRSARVGPGRHGDQLQTAITLAICPIIRHMLW